MTKRAERVAGRIVQALRFLFIIAFSVLLGWSVLSLPGSAPGLTAAVQAHLEQSGVSHPVTAVLLNFRGYDTLLEIAVLILAVLGVQSLRHPGGAPVATRGRAQLLVTLVRVLTPVMILAAGYLLWRGAHAPGGAFQGGAVLAAGAVLWSLAYGALPSVRSILLIRFGLILGFVVFLEMAIVAMIMGADLLEYPRARAGGLILLIEVALTVSIGMILAVLFAGVPGRCPNIAVDPSLKRKS